MSDDLDAIQQAAQIMARLCSSAATPYDRHELALLLQKERITLAQFATALSAFTDERGASAYSWEQAPHRRGHTWHLRKAEDVRSSDGGPTQLDVVLRCTQCGTVATFKAGAVPPCAPGEVWQWTGSGWHHTEDKGTP